MRESITNKNNDMARIKSICFGATDQTTDFFTTDTKAGPSYRVDSIEEFTHHQIGFTEDEYHNVNGRSYQIVYRAFKNGNLVATIINPVNCTIRYWD